MGVLGEVAQRGVGERLRAGERQVVDVLGA
jgi:hypothetical protein